MSDQPSNVPSDPSTTSSPSSNIHHIFLRLGSSLTRRIIFYLNPFDAGVLTASCKWLSDFRSSQFRHSSKWEIGDQRITEGCCRLLFDLRNRELAQIGDSSLRKDFVFEPQFTSLLHTEQINSHLLFLSLYKARVVIWEIVRGKIRIRENLPGPMDFTSCSVCDTAIAVLGLTTLTLNIIQWKSDIIHDKADFNYSFPNSVSTGTVTLLWKWKLVVTSRLDTVSVFSSELHPMWEYTHGINSLLGYFNISNPVYIPSPSRPCILHLFPIYYSIYDALENRLIVSKALHFMNILQSGMMYVSNGTTEKSYLVILGTNNSKMKLYVNGSQLSTRVSQFTIHGVRLVCVANNNELLIYEGDMEKVALIRSVRNPSISIDYFYVFSDMIVTLKVSKTRIGSTGLPTEEYSCMVNYLHNGSIIHKEKLEYKDVKSCIATRGNIVIQGSFHTNNIPCISVLHYFQDQQKEDSTMEGKFSAYRHKEEAYYKEKMDEKRREEMYKREKERRKADKVAIVKMTQEREEFMRGKTRKRGKDDIRSDLRDQLELIMRMRIPNNRQVAPFK